MYTKRRRRIMKIREIYDIAVPATKRKEERWNIWVAFCVRPLSVFLTKPLLSFKFKPLWITAISIVFCVAGFSVLFFANTILLKAIGWLLFFFWAILDGVDGNYARCSNQCSQLGDLWDTTGGYLAMVLLYFACGIVAFNDNNILYLLEPHYYLLLGGATALFSIFPRLVMHKKKSYGTDSSEIQFLSNKHSFGIVQILAMNLVSPSGFMQVIFLFCIIFRLTNVFIIAYFCINFLIMLISLFKLLRK